MNNTFKKIAATALAAVTLASTMVSASAYTVGRGSGATYDELAVTYSLPASKVASYPEFTKASLEADLKKYGYCTYRYNTTFATGQILGTFEKGMSFEDAYKYASLLQLRDMSANYAVPELCYNKTLGRYYLVNSLALYGKSYYDGNVINYNMKTVVNKINGINSVEMDTPSGNIIIAVTDRCFPIVKLYDNTSGKYFNATGTVNSNGTITTTFYLNQKVTAFKTYVSDFSIMLDHERFGPTYVTKLSNKAVDNGNRLIGKYIVKKTYVPEEPKNDDDDGRIDPPDEPVVPKYEITGLSGDTLNVTINKEAFDKEDHIKLDSARDAINFVISEVYSPLYYSRQIDYRAVYIKVRWDDNSSACTYAISSLK